MAITRTPIVDDDGSGTSGTILNNAWKQELYNQIDGTVAGGTGIVLPPYRIPSTLSISIPTSQNNWNPAGGANAVVWLLTPAVSQVITGLVAEAAGTMHLLINTSGNPLILYNQHVNSAVANRFVGPGYTDYSLGVWRSAWIRYTTEFSAWIILAP